MSRPAFVALGLGLIVAMASPGAIMAEPLGPPLCETGCATAVIPPIAASPFGVVSGPRGSIWFSLDHAVGRLDQRGAISVYPVSAADEQDVGWMTVDPAGAVWFAERDTGKVGRIMPNGVMTEFALPTASAVPQGIVLAPDGNLYISEQGANAIARLDPATGQATDFPVPTPDSTTQSGALGADGAIWFVERSAAKVGRMSLEGVFTEYPLAPGAFPNRIVAAADGALWFTELRAGKIGRITTGGVLTEYPIEGGPVGITNGKDGQLYVVLANVGAVARVNLHGQVTGHWDLPGAVLPLQIGTGFGLDLWVTDTFGGALYRVTPYQVGR